MKEKENREDVQLSIPRDVHKQLLLNEESAKDGSSYNHLSWYKANKHKTCSALETGGTLHVPEFPGCF